jgi:hypothetical protein
MAENEYIRIRDCANPAIVKGEREDGSYDLEIETPLTFKGVPDAIMIDGVRYEAAHA